MNFNPLIIVGRNRINGGLYCLKYSCRTRLAHSNGGPNYIFIFAIYSPWNLRGGNQDEENKYWKIKLHFGWILSGRCIKVTLPQHVAANTSQTQPTTIEFYFGSWSACSFFFGWENDQFVLGEEELSVYGTMAVRKYIIVKSKH